MYSSPKLHVQHICRKYWQYVQHMCTSLHIYLVKNTCTSYMQQCTYDVHMVDCMCYICDTEVHLSKSNFFCSAYWLAFIKGNIIIYEDVQVVDNVLYKRQTVLQLNHHLILLTIQSACNQRLITIIWILSDVI